MKNSTDNTNQIQHGGPALPAARGPLATIKEWVWCLFSVKHAETTWLRIAEDTERRAFRHMERFLFLLAGATIAAAFFAIKQQAFFHDVTIYEYPNETVYVKPR